jgi:hypothetical protein
LFLFASKAGLVSGWNPGVPPPPPSTQAQVGAGVRHASYKGLAIATTTPTGSLLYAADFHRGRIDVFDQGLERVRLSGRFRDPKLPGGYGRSTSRSWAGGCMSPTPSRTPTTPTRSPVRAAASSTSTAPAASGWTGWSAGAS